MLQRLHRQRCLTPLGKNSKKHHAEGTSAHILSHAVLGAAVAAAGGNDALAGALSAGGAEYLAPKASVGWALAAHHLVSLCFYKNNPSENQNLQGLFQFTVRVGINAHPTLAFGRTNMVRVGRIILGDAEQKAGQPSNIQSFTPVNVPSIGDVFNAIPSYK